MFTNNPNAKHHTHNLTNPITVAELVRLNTDTGTND